MQRYRSAVACFLCWLGLRVSSTQLTSPAVGMAAKKSRMPIVAKHTKEERKIERKKIGKLKAQVIAKKTEERYEDCFTEFRRYHGLKLDFVMPSAQLFDDMVAEYVEWMWKQGEPKSMANYTLAAVQFFRPETKHHLPWSWKLVKVWNSLELPQRAMPLTTDLLMGFCGRAFEWRQPIFAWLLIVGFTLFLRTGELMNLRVQDIVLSTKTGVVYLPSTKGAKRHLLPLERVEISEAVTVIALRALLKHKAPGDYLWPQSRQAFMTLWHDLVASLHLQDCGFYPYSLRRGGASTAYRLGAMLDELVTKGRWAHVQTARLYLDTGLQSLISFTLPDASIPLLRRCVLRFKSTMSQYGARGREAFQLR